MLLKYIQRRFSLTDEHIHNWNEKNTFFWQFYYKDHLHSSWPKTVKNISGNIKHMSMHPNLTN